MHACARAVYSNANVREASEREREYSNDRDLAGRFSVRARVIKCNGNASALRNGELTINERTTTQHPGDRDPSVYRVTHSRDFIVNSVCARAAPNGFSTRGVDIIFFTRAFFRDVIDR